MSIFIRVDEIVDGVNINNNSGRVYLELNEPESLEALIEHLQTELEWWNDENNQNLDILEEGD